MTFRNRRPWKDFPPRYTHHARRAIGGSMNSLGEAVFKEHAQYRDERGKIDIAALMNGNFVQVKSGLAVGKSMCCKGGKIIVILDESGKLSDCLPG